MGAFTRRCHVLEPDGTLQIASGLLGYTQPCGGGNTCDAYGETAMLAGRSAAYVAPPEDHWEEVTCEHTNTSRYGTGDLFCCTPTPPPPSSAFYFNAPHDQHTSNPDYGFTSFDNTAWAWLVVYRAITIEGWSISMQLMMDGAPSGAGWGVRTPRHELLTAPSVATAAPIMAAARMPRSRPRPACCSTQHRPCAAPC